MEKPLAVLDQQKGSSLRAVNAGKFLSTSETEAGEEKCLMTLAKRHSNEPERQAA